MHVDSLNLVLWFYFIIKIDASLLLFEILCVAFSRISCYSARTGLWLWNWNRPCESVCSGEKGAVTRVSL